MDSRGTLLWVGKLPVNGGGDEIYDRRINEQLARDFAVQRMQIPRQSWATQVAALAHGMPHPRFKYASNAIDVQFRCEAEKSNHVIVSWESFESLVWAVDRPVTLIIHNVMSDVLTQLFGRNPVLRWLALQSLAWEKRTYARSNLTIVVLSKRDRALIAARAPAAQVVIAPPGMPKKITLERDRLLQEVVISGSYDWAPKRRDLLALAAEVKAGAFGPHPAPKWRHDLPLPSVTGAAALKAVSQDIILADYSQGLRFGIIPDSFVGGFKLKSTHYIAHNCVLLSRCDIRDEFAGLPHAHEFVHFTPRLTDIASIVAEMAKRETPDLYARWREFQAACAEAFSWSASANLITSTF